jgi:hypothetical protein
MSDEKKLSLPEDVAKDYELVKPLFPGKFTLPNWGTVDFTTISPEKMKAMCDAGVRGIKKKENKSAQSAQK